MFFWIVNLFVLISYTLLLKKTKKNMVFLVVVIVHLGAIAALRGINVGTDTQYYAKAYNFLSNYGYVYEHAMSKSLFFINYLRVFSKMIPSYNGYMIATAVPTFFIIIYIIKRYSKDYYYSVLLYLSFYFYFYSLNASRQFLAIAITLVSFDLMNRKKYIISLVVYIISLGIHSAVIIYGLYFVIYFIRWNRKRILLVLLSGILASQLLMPLVNVFASFFGYQWMIRLNTVNTLQSQGRSSLVYAIYGGVAILLMVYCILNAKNKLAFRFGDRILESDKWDGEEERQANYRLIILVMIGTMLFAFFPTYILFNRMAYVVYVYIILLLPNAVESLKKYKAAIKLILLVPLFTFMFLLLANNYSSVLNYTLYC